MSRTSSPEISVVLPTWNRVAQLPRAIDSVLRQDFRDLELIVIDDASVDATPEVVASMPDPRVRYIRQPHNLGAAAARNAGIRAARSEWVAFQDSDDEWLPGKLVQQLHIARQSDRVGVVIGAYEAVTDDGNTIAIRPSSTLAGADPRIDLLDGWPIITPTWLVRRELLEQCGGFDESYPCLEDWDLVFRLSDRCTIAAAEGPILRKHGSVDSVCGDPVRMCDALQRILLRHRRRWDGEPRRLARRVSHLGALQFRLGRRAQARETLRTALALDPWTPATFGLLLASFAGGRAMHAAERAWPRHAGMAP